jgi:hypothetical protein
LITAERSTSWWIALPARSKIRSTSGSNSVNEITHRFHLVPNIEIPFGNPIPISTDREDAFEFGPTESEDTIGEEGRDDGNLLGG